VRVTRFLDSSVVIRYLTRDDAARSPIARDIIEREQDLALSTFVIGEIGYTLRSSYHYPRLEMLDAVVSFIALDNIVVVDAAKELVLVALAKCRARGALSFGDALILAQMQAAGCREIYSFDREFRDESIIVLDKPAVGS
jgi:predicted nucleic acid-binding protein